MVLCTLAKYDSSIPLQKKKKSAQTTYFCHYSKHCLPFKLENMLTFTVFLMIFFVRFLLWWTSLSSSCTSWCSIKLHGTGHEWHYNTHSATGGATIIVCCLIVSTFYCLPEYCLGTSQWYYSNHILNIFPLCMVHIRNYA